jgi:hypothetical protein
MLAWQATANGNYLLQLASYVRAADSTIFQYYIPASCTPSRLGVANLL